MVRQALGQLGVPGPRVHVERFLSLAENPFEAGACVRRDGGHAVGHAGRPDPPAALAAPEPGCSTCSSRQGLDAPYSCRQGICGACACQLTAGKVEMAHNEVLEAADLADGYILACQAVP